MEQGRVDDKHLASTSHSHTDRNKHLQPEHNMVKLDKRLEGDHIHKADEDIAVGPWASEELGLV